MPILGASVKQILVFGGETYVRYRYMLNWTNWEKELSVYDVDDEIEAYLDAITTALSS